MLTLTYPLLYSLCDEVSENQVVEVKRVIGFMKIVGMSYPVKEILKKVGCRWSSDNKFWYTNNGNWQNQALELADREKDKQRIRALSSEPINPQILNEAQ